MVDSEKSCLHSPCFQRDAQLIVQRFPKRDVGGLRFYSAAKVAAGTASLSVSAGLNRRNWNSLP